MVNEDEWQIEKMLKEGAVIVAEDTKTALDEEDTVDEKKPVNRTPMPLTAPFEKGGHSCGDCKRPLAHGDMLGFWDTSNTNFTVVGYYCPKCQKRFVMPKHHKKETNQNPKFRTMSGWERQFYRLSSY